MWRFSNFSKKLGLYIFNVKEEWFVILSKEICYDVRYRLDSFVLLVV